MTGLTSSISICSNTFILLGSKPISSFTDGSTEATIASNLYDGSYLSLLTNHRWRFATKRAKMSRLTGTPSSDYQYSFQIPSDCIYLITVTDKDYEIFGSTVHSNRSDLDIEYIYKVSEDKLPPYFVKTLEFFLASQFAVSLTGDLDKASMFEKMYLNQLRMAKFADSTQTPSDGTEDSLYLAVRN